MKNYIEIFKKAIFFLIKYCTIKGFEIQLQNDSEILDFGISPMIERIDIDNTPKYDEKTVSWIASNFLARFELLEQGGFYKSHDLIQLETEYYILKENVENEGSAFRQFMKEVAFEDQLYKAEFGKPLVEVEKLEIELQICIEAKKIGKEKGISYSEAEKQATQLFKTRKEQIETEHQELEKNKFFHINLKELQNQQLVYPADDDAYIQQRKKRKQWLKQATRMLTFDSVNQDIREDAQKRVTELQQKLLRGIKNVDLLSKSGTIAHSQVVQSEIDEIFFEFENIIAVELGLGIGIFEFFNYTNCQSIDEVCNNLKKYLVIFEKQINAFTSDAEEVLQNSDYEFQKHINNLPDSGKLKHHEELSAQLELLKTQLKNEKDTINEKTATKMAK